MNALYYIYIYVYRLCPIIICYIWHHATMAMVTLRIIRVHERRRIHGAAMGSVQWTRSRDSDFRWQILRILASELPAGMHSFVASSAVGNLTCSWHAPGHGWGTWHSNVGAWAAEHLKAWDKRLRILPFCPCYTVLAFHVPFQGRQQAQRRTVSLSSSEASVLELPRSSKGVFHVWSEAHDWCVWSRDGFSRSN